jgi:Ni,Fe-hydrogenase I large subunit
MDQKFTREDAMHAWYDEPGGLHLFDRTTVPTQKNTVDMAGKYSRSTAVRHEENGRLEAGPLARQMVAGGWLAAARNRAGARDRVYLDRVRRQSRVPIGAALAAAESVN